MTSFYRGIPSSQVRILCFKTVSYKCHHFTRETPLHKSVSYVLKLYHIDEFSLHKSVSYVLKPYLIDDIILQENSVFTSLYPMF